MTHPTALRTLALALCLGVGPATGARATDAEDPPRPAGCDQRLVETEQNLVELLEILATSQGPMRTGIWDRLRCAVHEHPERALRLLVPLVQSDDPSVRAMAAKSLGELGPEAAAAVPGLVAMLSAPDENSRILAAQTLARFGPQSEPAVDALIAVLDDESPHMRSAAARTLVAIGPGASRASVPLARLLSDPHPEVRGTATYAFQELAHHAAAATEELVRLLAHEDPGVRTGAAGAIGQIGPLAELAKPALEALLDDELEEASVRSAARVALGELDLLSALVSQREGGGHLLPLLLVRMEHEDPEVRREGTRLVGYLGPAGRPAAGALLERVVDEHAAVRMAAVHALGVVGAAEPAAVRAIALRLPDEDLHVRRVASRTLASFGSASAPAQAELVAALAADDSTVRQNASEALLAIEPGGQLVLPELFDLLAHEDAVVHFGAAYELARLAERYPEVVGELVAGLLHEDETVRLASARALDKLGPAAGPAVPVLRELLDGPDPRMRGVAADLLGKLGAELPEASGAEARELLATRLDHADLTTQRQAIQSLRHLGPAGRSQAPQLVALLRHSDLQTSQSAANTLAELLEGDPSPVMSDLRAMLDDPHPRVRTSGAYALSRYGSAATPALDRLVEMLDDEHPAVRGYAAVALGEIGPAAAEALPRLKELERDRDYRINSFARQAVGQIRAGGSPAKQQRSAKPIGQWLRELRDPSPGVHNRAVGAVSKMRPVAPETIPALVELLDEDDWTLRHRGLMVLGNLGAEASATYPHALERLSDENTHVRRQAVSALRRIPPASREDRLGLVSALEHADDYVRREARYTLEGWGTDAADVAPELAGLFEHEEDDVRYAAQRALAKVGPQTAVPLLIPYLKHDRAEVRGAAARILAEFGAGAAPAVPTLREMLREREHGRLAAQTLAAIGPDARPALPELVALLDASDPAYHLRPAAARALGAIGPGARDALPSLRRALARTNDSEASGRYRTALVSAISQIAGPGDPAVAAYARRMGKGLASSNPMTRVEAARALVGLGSSALPALPALRESLREDEQPKIRGLAADALGAIGPAAEPALGDLRRAQADEHPRVRKKATGAIEEIERRLASGEPAAEPGPAPGAAAIPEDQLSPAAPTLAEDIEALSGGGRESSQRILERGADALPALHEALLAPGADVQQRSRLIRLLGEIGDERSVAAILASLRAHPEEPLMGVGALRALSELPQISAAFAYAAGLVEDRDAPPRLRLAALIYFGTQRDSRAQPFAERFRNDHDPDTRAAALYLAARLGSQDAAEPITGLLGEGGSESTRYALLLGLAELVEPAAFEVRAAAASPHRHEYESALRIARYRSGTDEQRSSLFAEMFASRFLNERRLAIRGLVEREALDELDPYLETWWQVPPQLRALLQNELRRGGYEIVEAKRRVTVRTVLPQGS